ncbi:MAG: universal stress protein [Hyphomicrobiaceae bacterium]
MYKRILIPVDISHKERAQAMIQAADRLADDGAQITLYNVVEDVPSYITVQTPETVLETAKTNASKELAAIATQADIKAHVEVGRGRAHSTILDYADRIDADLIVVASHKPGLQDFLLGSTAARVVRHATCTVLIIR